MGSPAIVTLALVEKRGLAGAAARLLASLSLELR